jgi:hypothetical protein
MKPARFLRDLIVVVSEPYICESGWAHITGDAKSYSIHKFQEKDDAYASIAAMKLGLQLSPEITVQLITITAEEASALTSEYSYQTAVMRWCQDSKTRVYGFSAPNP